MKINNIEGITISEIAKEFSLNPQTIKAYLRRRGLTPIVYIGQVGIYSDTVLKVIKERNPQTGPRAKAWQPKT
jgi:hypothetical protein